MPGLKKYHADFRFSGNRVTPDEIDRYEQYVVAIPSVSPTWVGTAAGGTSTQAKALVLINKNLDYPRNLLYGVVGTADMGGTWVVNGKDQFGNVITETVGAGTAAAGTPVFATSGTKIFAQVTSGTFTVATGAVGSGSARLGVSIAAAGTTKFGLPNKLGAVTDVKSISWIKENVQTTLNGGTVDSTLVDTTYHAFSGTAVLGGTESFVVLYRPTKDLSGTVNQASL